MKKITLILTIMLSTSVLIFANDKNSDMQKNKLLPETTYEFMRVMASCSGGGQTWEIQTGTCVRTIVNGTITNTTCADNGARCGSTPPSTVVMEP